MRQAVFAATRTGLCLAVRLRSVLAGAVDIYAPQRHVDFAARAASEQAAVSNGWTMQGYERLADCVAGCFHRYDALVFIMAAGIVVRMIAPHLENKLQDPAVVVMDEQARHVVSLLSGHIGGANLLTQQLARGLGADPVITTATDVEKKLAPDMIAAELGMRPWPKNHIKTINSALLEGKKLGYFVDDRLTGADSYREQLYRLGIQVVYSTMAEAEAADFLVYLLPSEADAFTDRPVPNHILCLSPRRLWAGVGCRRGTPKEEILSAVQTACSRIGQETAGIFGLASTLVKRDEEGLLAAAAKLGRDILFFDNETLGRMIRQYGLTESPFVKKTIGIGNVCEAAALAAAAPGRIVLPKMNYGKVTVALVWQR